MKIAVVAVPYGHDIGRWGYAGGPEFFLEHGLVRALEQHGHTVGEPVFAHLPRERRTRDTVTNLARINASASDLVSSALHRRDTLVLALTGNCTHAPGVAGGIFREYGEVGIAWYDAHGDMHTMRTSETGFWGGMPYAVALGWDFPDWREAAGLARPVPPEAAAILGTSDLDAAEVDAIKREGLAHLDARDLTPANVRALLGPRRGASGAWYLHIDMDVAGPEAPGVVTPAPYWPSRERLLESVVATAQTVPLVAMALSSINPPGDPEGRAPRLGIDLAVAVADALEAL